MPFIQHETGGVVFTASQQFDNIPGLAHGFSTRLGGVSQGVFSALNLAPNRGDDPDCVRENFRRFCAATGTDMDAMVFSNQVHGDAVRVCTGADAGRGLGRDRTYEADGLVTDVPGLPLVIFTADCIPILLCDPVRRVVGAVHAGWRGTALGIAERAAEKMRDCYGCDPADILAAVGPGISQCCFETREDVPNAMTEAMGAAALPYIQAGEDGKFHVDLKGLNARRLERAGLDSGHIDISGECTACLPERYWSHRVTNGVRGSQAAVIQLL